MKCFYALWISKRNIILNDKKDGVWSNVLWNTYAFCGAVFFSHQSERRRYACVCMVRKVQLQRASPFGGNHLIWAPHARRSMWWSRVRILQGRIYRYHNKCEEWNNLHFLSSSRRRERVLRQSILLTRSSDILVCARQNGWFRDWISGCCIVRDETRAKNVGKAAAATATWESCLKWIRATSLERCNLIDDNAMFCHECAAILPIAQPFNGKWISSGLRCAPRFSPWEQLITHTRVREIALFSIRGLDWLHASTWN